MSLFLCYLLINFLFSDCWLLASLISSSIFFFCSSFSHIFSFSLSASSSPPLPVFSSSPPPTSYIVDFLSLSIFSFPSIFFSFFTCKCFFSALGPFTSSSIVTSRARKDGKFGSEVLVRSSLNYICMVMYFNSYNIENIFILLSSLLPSCFSSLTYLSLLQDPS